MQDSTGLAYFTCDSNGMNLLAERDIDGTVTAGYTHGHTPIDGIGSVVAAKKDVAGTAYYQYPLMDHRGTVVGLTDASGAPVASYKYNAWGVMNPVRARLVGRPEEYAWSSARLHVGPRKTDPLGPTRVSCRSWATGAGSYGSTTRPMPRRLSATRRRAGRGGVVRSSNGWSACWTGV